MAVLLSLPLVLTMWSIFWFTVSVTSLAYKPTIPPFPPVWAYWQRYGTLSLVCCLVVVVATVGWFFRGRRDTPAKPPAMSLPFLTEIPSVPDSSPGAAYDTPMGAQLVYPSMNAVHEVAYNVTTATARPRSI